jgi:adenine-specific DNA-methyltransferase
MGEEKTYEELLADNRIVFPRGGDGMPRKKYYRYERELEGQCATNWWEHTRFGHNQGANDLITSFFNIKNVFSNPKPIELLRGLLQIANVKNNSIILDFFSGSATTAHAVMQLNAEDGGNRQFIMVQLPEVVTEKTSKEAFDFLTKEKKPLNICEIGKERIRRAGKKIADSQKPAIDQLQLAAPHSLDTGFKVFRLAQSNYKKWKNYTGTDIKETEELFSQYENPLVDNWKEENLLTEIMLIEGFPLNSSVIIVQDYKKNRVIQIKSDFCEHSLYICLDRAIHAETIKGLTLSDHDIFICLYNAITDQDKARLDDKGQIKTI